MEEEVEVVNSIYENCVTQKAQGLYSIAIPNSPVTVKLSFPPEYPECPPRIVSVDAPETENWLARFEEIIRETFTQDAYIFTFIDEVLQILPETWPNADQPVETVQIKGSEFIHDWTVSEEIIDRKSVFVARALTVTTQEDALAKIADLLLDKKIAKATHNIQAWRIERPDGLLVQDCDDDGESAAGSRLLHLLNLTNCLNVVVVVSRWYGGTLLGPDRFKHINACARDALVKGGFIKS